jgi:hypothetical protein
VSSASDGSVPIRLTHSQRKLAAELLPPLENRLALDSRRCTSVRCTLQAPIGLGRTLHSPGAVHKRERDAQHSAEFILRLCPHRYRHLDGGRASLADERVASESDDRRRSDEPELGFSDRERTAIAWEDLAILQARPRSCLNARGCGR